MPASTESTMQTHAEYADEQRLEESIAYAADQLKQGKCLVLTNNPEGKRIGNCGHDPRDGRDWLTRLMESPVRAWR
ncbi:hypothetical protein [Streptomyces sp. NPDC087297]|uniref:hypothetical protein n=1 Tax=Streptomyces sp. NPDC087297 TaxID=3365778 RepID=UPI0037FF7E34